MLGSMRQMRQNSPTRKNRIKNETSGAGRQESVKSQTVKMKSFLLVIIAKNISVLSQDVIH